MIYSHLLFLKPFSQF
uniref:Uncharacterized protein n=1 Tax=Anguilla anguilla TaxID=7936 RepID=A0A0E9UB94_ANGAN